MSTTITCLKELEERKELQTYDIIKFTIKGKTIRYHVYFSCLFNRDEDKYNEIFRVLKIDRIKIAEKAYRYKTDDRIWPASKPGDFPALTRLVKKLYLIIKEKETIYTKFTRFEIMDI